MPLRKILIIFFILFNTIHLFAQPEFNIQPNKLVFEDIFNRIETAYLINSGNTPLTIDSVKFNPDFYSIDFEDNLQLPFNIDADDTIGMNVSLIGFYYITVTDTIDTLVVYNNSSNNAENLRLKIDFFEDEFGTINGTITDGIYPVANAFVYFFYNGVYLVDTAETDINGNYSITLPEGDYTVSSQKKGFHLSYYGNTFDPFYASNLELEPKASLQTDLTLKAIIDSSKSVRGRIFNSKGTILPNRGVVIVRKGRHVPTNSPQSVNDTSSMVYSGLINPDGTYEVYMDSADYYFVHAFTNYYLPGFYNEADTSSIFWQGSDSLLIDNSVTNKNIFLSSDSSYGGGTISGKIIFSNSVPGLDYEGITLISRSTYNERLCSYGFCKPDGTYLVPNIPYGEYIIVAQKIGFENSISRTVYIDSNHTSYTNVDIVFDVTDVKDDYLQPQEVELYPGFPNPFNPVTNITFNLPEAANIKLKVLNILGETVEVLLDSYFPAGKYNYNFTAKDLSSGVYIVTLQTGSYLKSQKIVLLK